MQAQATVENKKLVPDQSAYNLSEDMEATNVNHIWQLNEGIHEDSYWANHTEDYLRWYSAPWEMTRTNYPPCP